MCLLKTRSSFNKSLNRKVPLLSYQLLVFVRQICWIYERDITLHLPFSSKSSFYKLARVKVFLMVEFSDPFMWILWAVDFLNWLRWDIPLHSEQSLGLVWLVQQDSPMSCRFNCTQEFLWVILVMLINSCRVATWGNLVCSLLWINLD